MKKPKGRRPARPVVTLPATAEEIARRFFDNAKPASPERVAEKDPKPSQSEAVTGYPALDADSGPSWWPCRSSRYRPSPPAGRAPRSADCPHPASVEGNVADRPASDRTAADSADWPLPGPPHSAARPPPPAAATAWADWPVPLAYAASTVPAAARPVSRNAGSARRRSAAAALVQPWANKASCVRSNSDIE